MIFDRRTNYARGADFERKVRDHLLHDLGARLVIRAAGSHGIADLVALWDAVEIMEAHGAHVVGTGAFGSTIAHTHYSRRLVPHVWLVQVKKHGKIAEDERQLLLDVAAETGAVPYLATHAFGFGVRMEPLTDQTTATEEDS